MRQKICGRNDNESLEILLLNFTCTENEMDNVADLYVLIFKFSRPYLGTKRFLN